MLKDRQNIEISSFALHIFAMFCMLLDHIWGVMMIGNDWMTCIGRIAFPMFAFMIAEGCYYTKDIKKYTKRLLLFAIISEIPFNFMMGSSIIYPFHQNVLWTFLIAVFVIQIIEKAKNSGKKVLIVLAIVVGGIIGYLLGVILMTDYNGCGVLTVLLFYLFRDRGKWYNIIITIIGLLYINCFMIGGFEYNIGLFGKTIFINQQAFAVLALMPIFLYHGKQGNYNKIIKNIYYWFYPAHIALLVIIHSIIV